MNQRLPDQANYGHTTIFLFDRHGIEIQPTFEILRAEGGSREGGRSRCSSTSGVRLINACLGSQAPRKIILTTACGCRTFTVK